MGGGCAIGGAGQRGAVGTVDDGEGTPGVLAGQHAAAMTDDDQGAVLEQTAIGQAELQRTALGEQLDLLPALAEIGGAEQVAAQAISHQGIGAGSAERAEQGTLVGALDFLPGLSPIGGTEHAARLAHHEQAGILHRGDAVEVVTVLVVQTVADIIPGLATVAGFQQRTVGADGVTGAGITEPDIQQRRFALQVLVLQFPVGAAVIAGEDLCVVTDRPAMLVIDEVHGGQQLAAGHAGLHPVATGVFGEQDVAAIADGDQALAGMGDVQQQAGHGLGRFDGGNGGCVRGLQRQRRGEGQNGTYAEQRQRFRQRRWVTGRGLETQGAGAGAPHDGLTHIFPPLFL